MQSVFLDILRKHFANHFNIQKGCQVVMEISGGKNYELGAVFVPTFKKDGIFLLDVVFYSFYSKK